MNTLSLSPKVNAAEVERMFNSHIQDVLMVSYLANTIRTQIDLSGRLATYNFEPKNPLAVAPAATTASK
jgi:translation initiation factor 3 subunit F